MQERKIGCPRRLYIYIYFFKYKLIYFNWMLITLQYCIGFANIDMNLPWVYMCSPSWTPLPPPSPYHPCGSSQCTSPEYPVSCIEPGLAIHFTCIIHVSMPLSQIIPPFPSPKSPEDCSVHQCLFSCLTYSYRYHLSKFHIYACIGVFLSGFLHSV